MNAIVVTEERMPEYEGPESELGRRLGWLRSQCGLTQRELARRLGLTQSAVSRIESGDRKLSAAQLIRVAEILGVDLASLTGTAEAQTGAAAGPVRRQSPSGLFIAAPTPVQEGGGPRLESEGESRPAELTLDTEVTEDSRRLLFFQQPHEDDIAYRGGVINRVAGSLADRVFLRGSADDLVASAQEEAGEGQASPGSYPAAGPERRGMPRLPALQPGVFAEVVADALALEELAASQGLPPATHVSWADRRLLGPLSPEPAQAARFWRHELGVGVEGPLPDLVTLLEGAGVYVVHACLESDVPAGACAEVADTAFLPSSPQGSRGVSPTPRLLPFVFVNGRRPVVLQRFALAHEFAHLALGHRDAYDERIDWSGRSGREVAANAFAEEFLAPTAAVTRWLEARGGPEVDLEVVVDLASYFGVSFWAARYRLRAAGRLPARRLRELDDGLRRQEWELLPRQTFLGGLRDTLSVLTAESRSDRQGRSHSEPGAGERGITGRGSEEPPVNLLRMAPQGVRVPSRMRALALALLKRGVISLEQAAVLLRFDPPSLREQLARLGL